MVGLAVVPKVLAMPDTGSSMPKPKPWLSNQTLPAKKMEREIERGFIRCSIQN